MIRSPWRRVAGWSPEEAAAELHSRRSELIGQLRRRSQARGVPPAAQEEIVDDARLARAHVDACVPCGRVYRRLRREMRGREFQRAAAAAFLPVPATSLGHVGGLGKLAVWMQQRINFLPRGGGERATQALGGAGLVKAAAAGTALVVAGSALGGHLVHDITASNAPRAHRGARIERRAEEPVRLARPAESVVVSARASSLSVDPSRQRVTVHRSSPAPPSRSDGYLALGGSSGGSSPSSSSESSSPVRAAAASVAQSGSTSSSEAAPQPAQSGGGTGLGYLGR